MKLIGVYGTLKAGQYNHIRFGLQNCIRQADSTIRGAMDLYAYSYPRLYADGLYPQYEQNHVLEVYEAYETLYNRLDTMERGAGYYTHTESLEDGRSVDIWLMDPKHPFIPSYAIKSFPVV